jgi:hypothetical protein
MKPDSTIVTSAGIGEMRVETLARNGNQYAVYVFGPGPHHLTVALPPGRYTVEFMDPLTGKYEEKQVINSDGSYAMTTPAYQEDVAVKILVVDK